MRVSRNIVIRIISHSGWGGCFISMNSGRGDEWSSLDNGTKRGVVGSIRRGSVAAIGIRHGGGSGRSGKRRNFRIFLVGVD